MVFCVEFAAFFFQEVQTFPEGPGPIAGALLSRTHRYKLCSMGTKQALVRRKRDDFGQLV